MLFQARVSKVLAKIGSFGRWQVLLRIHMLKVRPVEFGFFATPACQPGRLIRVFFFQGTRLLALVCRNRELRMELPPFIINILDHRSSPRTLHPHPKLEVLMN